MCVGVIVRGIAGILRDYLPSNRRKVRAQVLTRFHVIAQNMKSEPSPLFITLAAAAIIINEQSPMTVNHAE